MTQGDRRERDQRDDQRDDSIDRALRDLGEPCQPPALCDELEAELQDLAPVPTRSRTSGFLLIGLVSLIYGLSALVVMDLRPDLRDLPRIWLVVYSLAWLASFAVIAYLAVVPVRGQVAPNWRYAGGAAVVASICFIIGGLLFDRHVPGQSELADDSIQGMFDHGIGCLSVGILTALVPVLLGALILRGRLPVGSRLAGAGLGAAGGSLGGLVLHLHCHIADGLHLGIIHGGVVALGALVGGALLPRTSSV